MKKKEQTPPKKWQVKNNYRVPLKNKQLKAWHTDGCVSSFYVDEDFDDFDLNDGGMDWKR